jgi:hypothetical protein
MQDTVRCDDCYATLNLEVNAAIKTSSYELDNFKVTVAGAVHAQTSVTVADPQEHVEVRAKRAKRRARKNVLRQKGATGGAVGRPQQPLRERKESSKESTAAEGGHRRGCRATPTTAARAKRRARNNPLRQKGVTGGAVGRHN